jgi:hypothetical protein
MKVKLGQFEMLNYALAVLCRIDLPRPTSHNIADFIVKQFEDENEIFTKERIKICEKYADRDESGNIIYLAGGNNYQIITLKVEWDKEIKEYFEKEIEFDFVPMTEAELGNDKIKPEILIILKKCGFLI